MKKYVFLIGILALIYLFIVRYNCADWDLWARLAVGSIFYHTGTILKHDVFAYTPTKHLWVDHEWGSGAVFYYLAHSFGDIGLLALKFLLMLGIFFFVFETNELRSNGKDPYRIGYYFIFFMGLLLGFNNVIRSQSFTYFFFALWIYLLDRIKIGNNKLIWLFPATMLLWANLHGGFLAGLGLVLIYGIGEAINRRNCLKYFIILGLSTIATLINPYGISYWTYMYSAVTMDRPYVSEWNPINIFGPLKELFQFKIWVILSAFALPHAIIKRFKELNWAEILIMAATLYMSLKHMRHVIFFIIAAASYMYYPIYSAFDAYTKNVIGKFYALFPNKLRFWGKFCRDFAVYGLIIFSSFLTLVFVPPKVKANENLFPTRAVKFIQMNKLSGNLLVLFNWGSYALWKLHPQCLVAVDGRYEEVYSDSLIDDVARFHYAGVNWDGLLRKYHTDIMLIPTQYDVYNNVLMLKDWRLVYKDKVAAVFLPNAKAKGSWIYPPKNFNVDKEKYESNI